jgi:hypothetical protein
MFILKFLCSTLLSVAFASPLTGPTTVSHQVVESNPSVSSAQLIEMPEATGPKVVQALSKVSCDEKYENAIKVCQRLYFAAWRRASCYAGASEAYAECLATASYGGGTGGGSLGGR